MDPIQFFSTWGKLKTLSMLLLALTLSYCTKKEEEPEVAPEEKPSLSYPVRGHYGKNLLVIPDNDTLSIDSLYSLSAISEYGGELIITMRNKSEGTQKALWFYDVSSVNDWFISTYDFSIHEQTFEIETDEKAELEVFFDIYEAPGKAEIEIKELNTGKAVVIKTIYWE